MPDHVTIKRIELDTAAAPAGLFGGYQRGATAGKPMRPKADCIRGVEPPVRLFDHRQGALGEVQYND